MITSTLYRHKYAELIIYRKIHKKHRIECKVIQSKYQSRKRGNRGGVDSTYIVILECEFIW